MSWENLFGELFLGDLGCSFAGMRSWENLVIIVGFLLLVVDWVKEGADVVIVPSNFFLLLFNRFFFFGLLLDRLLWKLVLGCFLTFVDLFLGPMKRPLSFSSFFRCNAISLSCSPKPLLGGNDGVWADLGSGLAGAGLLGT